MVKLKVYVRVIPESVYGEDAAAVQPRKFVVVVRDPTEWFVGTLAREAQRTYQRLYRHELGKVKYLKDGDDNDLDPEQYVADIFVNEGKAARDGLDQQAIIKIIQEQGHTVRADSVVPDLTPAYFSQPPVSRFASSSTLGKRGHSAIGVSQELTAAKRSRLVEIPESQELVQSVERSPELIHDTQQDGPEDEVFDDAKEYHPERPKAGKAILLSVTPSTHALSNGSAAHKSPVQQTSSASRFKVGNHRDVYAYPESDIEDSQMVHARPPTLTNGMAFSQSTGQVSSQLDGLPKAVKEFNAQEALFPMDLDESVQANTLASSQKPNRAAGADSKPPYSDDSESDQEAPELKVPKARQWPTLVKANISTESPELERQKTPSLMNGIQRPEKKQTESEATSPGLTSANKKQQKSNSISKLQQLKPAISLSPSRRTSGVVSELDSPGEQLSQGLRDFAKDHNLAEGVQAALGGKSATKKKPRLLNRRERNAGRSDSSSVASSRPMSREGLVESPAPTKATKKVQPKSKKAAVSKTKAEDKTQEESTKLPVSKAMKDSNEKTAELQATKSKSLMEKIADASTKAANETSGAVGARQKENAVETVDQSESDNDGAPLPSIENTPMAPPKASSFLPLPNWGSASNDPTSGAARTSPSFIVPVGMTEEEYIRLRTKNERTPQPPKTTTAIKRKASTSAVAAKTPTSVVKDVVNKGKKVVGKTTGLAKSVAKKSAAVESSSEQEESSSSEDSDDDTADKTKSEADKVIPTKSSSKSKSKSASPAEVRRAQPSKTSTTKDSTSMPPPTPKSTAKRRESINKQYIERSLSSASTHTSSTSSQQKTSEALSSSSSPAPTKTPAQRKPPVNASQAKNSTPAAHKPASPVPATRSTPKPTRPANPARRETALQALRARMNSEAASPAPSAASARGKKKAATIALSSSSSSSEEESSSDSSEDETKKAKSQQSLGKAKIDTPVRVLKKSEAKVRKQPIVESSDDSDDE